MVNRSNKKTIGSFTHKVSVLIYVFITFND